MDATPLRACYRLSYPELVAESLTLFQGPRGLSPSLDVLWNEPSLRVLHVTGDAGAGKSALLRRLARDWASGQLWATQFDVVVLVDWAVSRATSLLEAVVEQGPSVEWTHELLTWGASFVGQRRLLWMFDGLDALTGTRREEVQRMVEPLQTVLFVSRPGLEWLPSDAQLRYRCVWSTDELLRFVRRRSGVWSATAAATTLYLCILHHRRYAALRPIAAAKICEPLLHVEHELPPVYLRVKQLTFRPYVLEAFRTPVMAVHLVDAVSQAGPRLTPMLSHIVSKLLEAHPNGPSRDQLRALAWQRWWQRSDAAAHLAGAVPGLFELDAFTPARLWTEFFVAEYVSYCLNATAAEAVLVAARKRGLFNNNDVLPFLVGIGAPHVMSCMEMWIDGTWFRFTPDTLVMCLDEASTESVALSLRHLFEHSEHRRDPSLSLMETAVMLDSARAVAFLLSCGAAPRFAGETRVHFFKQMS